MRIFPGKDVVKAQWSEYILEQLNHTSGERRIATRTKLDFVEFWSEVVVIHEQRIFVPIVGYFFTIIKGWVSKLRGRERRTYQVALLSFPSVH